MCFVRNCLPSDCAELKAQNTVTNSIDGNYTILVAGFRVQVYCHLMNETIPKTYLNVPDQTNFAEFYGKRFERNILLAELNDFGINCIKPKYQRQKSWQWCFARFTTNYDTIYPQHCKISHNNILSWWFLGRKAESISII